MLRPLATCILLGLLLPRAAAQQVHIVGPPGTPGPHFELVQPAVNAAADGDVIVILPGLYDTVVLDDRDLVLVGVPGLGGGRARILSLVIHSLAPARSVVVRGLDLIPTDPNGALAVLDCEGSVFLEDVQVDPIFPVSLLPPRIERSDHVVIARSTLRGGNGVAGLFQATEGGVGLRITDATVALYDSLVVGGTGSYGQVVIVPEPVTATDGGPGLHIVSGTVILARSEVRGGAGGGGLIAPGGCSPPGSGGIGLTGDGLLRRFDDAVIAGGPPGTQPGCGPDGTPGIAQAFNGTVIAVPAAPYALQISSPVEEGGVCHVAAQGAPFQPVLLLQASAPLGTWLNGLKGTLAGAPPLVVFALQLGHEGTLGFDVLVPFGLLPAGIDAVSLVDQLLGAGPTGGAVLSVPSSVVLVREIP